MVINSGTVIFLACHEEIRVLLAGVPSSPSSLSVATGEDDNNKKQVLSEDGWKQTNCEGEREHNPF